MSRRTRAVLATTVSIGVGLGLASIPVGAQAVPQAALQTSAQPSARQAQAPEVLAPLSLPRGPRAKVVHLQNGVIRRPDGTRVGVKVPYTNGYVQLLGPAKGGGFLVAAGAVRSNRIPWAWVYRVRAGKKPVQVPNTRMRMGPSAGVQLSRDGGTMALVSMDRVGSNIRVQDVATGKKIASMVLDYRRPVDLADGKVLTWSEETTTPIVWSRQGELALPGEMWGGFLRRDVLFTGTEKAGGGPTSLSNPTTPAWRAQFLPLSLSPDKKTVLGNRPARFKDPDMGRSVLEVRRMSDGKVLRTLVHGPKGTGDGFVPLEQTARFETNDAYLVQMSTPKGAVLVRCRLSTTQCRRASEVGSNVSMPYEQFAW